MSTILLHLNSGFKDHDINYYELGDIWLDCSNKLGLKLGALGNELGFEHAVNVKAGLTSVTTHTGFPAIRSMDIYGNMSNFSVKPLEVGNKDVRMYGSHCGSGRAAQMIIKHAIISHIVLHLLVGGGFTDDDDRQMCVGTERSAYHISKTYLKRFLNDNSRDGDLIQYSIFVEYKYHPNSYILFVCSFNARCDFGITDPRFCNGSLAVFGFCKQVTLKNAAQNIVEVRLGRWLFERFDPLSEFEGLNKALGFTGTLHSVRLYRKIHWTEGGRQYKAKEGTLCSVARNGSRHVIRLCLVVEFHVETSDGGARTFEAVYGHHVEVTRKQYVFVGEITKTLMADFGSSLLFPHKSYHRCTTSCRPTISHKWRKRQEVLISPYVASGCKMLRDPTKLLYAELKKLRKASSTKDAQCIE